MYMIIVRSEFSDGIASPKYLYHSYVYDHRLYWVLRRYCLSQIRICTILMYLISIRGAFGKLVAWHHNSTVRNLIKWYQLIHFLESRIQRLLGGYIFMENVLGVHVLCMLK